MKRAPDLTSEAASLKLRSRIDHATEAALGNLRCGETPESTYLYLQHAWPKSIAMAATGRAMNILGVSSETASLRLSFTDLDAVLDAILSGDVPTIGLTGFDVDGAGKVLSIEGSPEACASVASFMTSYGAL